MHSVIEPLLGDVHDGAGGHHGFVPERAHVLARGDDTERNSDDPEHHGNQGQDRKHDPASHLDIAEPEPSAVDRLDESG